MANRPVYKFEVFRSDKNHNYYWHLLAGGNKTIFATSGGDGYVEKRECLEGLALVKAFASGAPVVDYSGGNGSVEIADIGDLVKRMRAG